MADLYTATDNVTNQVTRRICNTKKLAVFL